VPTPKAAVGFPFLLSQNIVTALPTEGLYRLTCDDTTATFQVSNDPTFTNNTSATLSGGGFDSGFAFIRVTNKDATICVKKWNA
jgi:hypothetical protein